MANKQTRAALDEAVKALAWYADHDNWHRDDWNVAGVINPPDYGNPGQKARDALITVSIHMGERVGV